MIFFNLIAATLLGATTIKAVSTLTPSTLNITVLSAQDNQSKLECWALEPGFIPSTQVGVIGSATVSMGSVGDNATFALIPGRFDGGEHNAPTRQWVIFLSGLAHITLPHSDDEAWILGGKHGVILALDTADVSADGHYTDYPSDDVTVAIELPLGNGGEVPTHQFLYGGACNATEVDF